MARVKGAAIVDTVRYLRRHKDRARALLPPELHHYLSQRVLLATWYPEADLVPLVRAMAQIHGESEQVFFEKAGRLAAYSHAQGVYRHLVDGARDSLARRAFILWTSQHDTGSMEMVAELDGQVRVKVRDFAEPTREFCEINAGYIAATFEIGGCKEVRVDKQSCLVDGDSECCWIVSWDAAHS